MKEVKKTMSEKKENDFFDRPEVIRWILRSFYACCFLLVAADFIVHRHIYSEIEKIPTFYAAYGLISCVLLVWAAKLIRLFVMRSESYYGDDADERGHLDD